MLIRTSLDNLYLNHFVLNLRSKNSEFSFGVPLIYFTGKLFTGSLRISAEFVLGHIFNTEEYFTDGMQGMALVPFTVFYPSQERGFHDIALSFIGSLFHFKSKLFPAVQS